MAIYDIDGNEIVEPSVTVDPTFTQEESAADAKLTGDYFTKLDAFSEPVDGDIPELHFTGTLPESKDDGKLLLKVEYYSKTQKFSEWCTLKVQGDGSVKYPKKNFNIQFFKDSAKAKKSKHNFKMWGEQSKFTLKANWSDITHARNICMARIWTDMLKTRADFNSLPDDLINSPNFGVIDGFTVKFFCNGIYYGRYTLNIPKDPWMFNMDDELENNVVLYGESKSTNSSTCFKASAVVDGTDWTDEIHEDDVPTSVVTNLNAFISFVMNSTDAQFKSNLSNYISVPSIIDVYLYAYANCGVDSIGKNEMFLSYAGSKYIASVYDLDCVYGLRWDGVLNYSPTYPFNSYNGSLLHERLESLFSSEIRARYTELRDGPLSEGNIIRHFEQFMSNLSPELIAEDYATTTADGAYINMPSVDTNNIQQIRSFIVARREYVDSMILT